MGETTDTGGLGRSTDAARRGAPYAGRMARSPRRDSIPPADGARIASALHETRSCVVVVLNRSPRELVLSGAKPLHGVFQPGPPVRIAPGALGAFGAQSAPGQGGAGCAAIVTYEAGSGIVLSLRFDVPYAGRNAAAATVSGPEPAALAVASSAGPGHVRAAIRFVIDTPAENEVLP
jgi:hypothetical protein